MFQSRITTPICPSNLSFTMPFLVFIFSKNPCFLNVFLNVLTEEEEVKILKCSLKHPREPKYLLKTDIMATFEKFIVPYHAV